MSDEMTRRIAELERRIVELEKHLDQAMARAEAAARLGAMHDLP